MNYQKIQTRQDGHALWITLNRPDASNAFDEQMIEEFVHCLEKMDEDNSIRCAVVTGAGKNFCAGGDVKKMQNKEGMFAGDPNELRERYKRGIQKIPLTFEKLSTPVIAMVNGAAIGAGLDMACMCDIRVSSPKAKFGETFAKLGLVPGDGGSYFLQRVVGFSKAMEMTLTAGIYSAEEAKQMGLVNFVEEDFEAKTKDLVKAICSNAPIAIQMAKRSIEKAYRADMQTVLELMAAYQGIAQRTQDHFNGVDSLINKSQINFSHK